MNGFKKLTKTNQVAVIRLWEALTKKNYNDFERKITEEEYNKSIKERKRELNKYKKYVKLNK